jgi:DNA polymerase epsilon subunit 1
LRRVGPPAADRTACRRRPLDTPTSERAVPVIIFSTAPAAARSFLRAWTGEIAGGDPATPPDVREFIDWDYYKERLGSTIQKIITIPAAYQVGPPTRRSTCCRSYLC